MANALEFRIHGMDCADEVAILRRDLAQVVGTPERLSFDILRGKRTVAAGSPEITADRIVEAVARSGMRAVPWQDVQPQAGDRNFWERRGRTLLTAISGVSCVPGFSLHARSTGVRAALGSERTGLAEAVPILSVMFYTVAIIAGAWFVVPRAWRAVLRMRPDMNLLMTLAVIGAVSIGEWFEASVVAFLFAFSLALESWSVGRARRVVEALLAIAPPTASAVRHSYVHSPRQPLGGDCRRHGCVDTGYCQRSSAPARLSLNAEA